MTLINPEATKGVLMEVLVERERQDDKWSEQNHASMVGADTPGGGGARSMFARFAQRYQQLNDSGAELDWIGIFLEEVYEACAEKDEAKIRAELVQAVAVGVAWIECIDRRAAAVSDPPGTVAP